MKGKYDGYMKIYVFKTQEFIVHDFILQISLSPACKGYLI